MPMFGGCWLQEKKIVLHQVFRNALKVCLRCLYLGYSIISSNIYSRDENCCFRLTDRTIFSTFQGFSVKG